METKRKTMIVTGASKGIGAGVTNAFIERGYNVVANSLSITSSAFAATERLAVVQGDIGDPSTAKEIASTAIKTFGSIDGVINNAGIFFTKPFEGYTAEDFEKLSRTNLRRSAKFVGRLGAELSVEEARNAARLAAINGLAVARQHLGSLDKVTRIVRLGVSVATSGDVREHPKAADGASELLQDVFGKEKNPTRLVYGVASLPLGAPVALELIFEVAGQGAAAGEMGRNFAEG